MIKTRVMEAKTSGKERVEDNDDLWLKVIAAYHKSIGKSVAEYEKLGERGEAEIVPLRAEMAYLETFLPKQMSDEEVQAVVAEAIKELGATDVKMAGRIVGQVMKGHRGKVDAGRIKAAVESQLG